MGERPPRSRHFAAALVTAFFWLYAATLFLFVRSVGHTHLTGWRARLLTVGELAVGLLPWVQWLQPRVARFMSLVGGSLLILCYFTCLAPFALLSRLLWDPLRMRRVPDHSSLWVVRPPLPTSLDASRLEY
ncbi:MAG: hypothetical protein HYY58_03905 [Candidatus Omnitrophica bacterium]|nr:hypothetical protein [Candidatus Omnitrophota bacterium]MBI3011617.1 hypothetical protein [Candidatus Omnitrophota bacterium]